jgi:hypothetical protein
MNSLRKKKSSIFCLKRKTQFKMTGNHAHREIARHTAIRLTVPLLMTEIRRRFQKGQKRKNARISHT